MATKRCQSCEVRPADRKSPEGRLCGPCLTEAEWENTHSDWDHEGIAERDHEGADPEQATMVNCWICHPELNQASADYTATNGSERKGMTITAKGTVKDKVAIFIEAAQAKGYATKSYTRKGITSLSAAKSKDNGFTLLWEGNRYTGGTFVQATGEGTGRTRKVRNLSEAMRILGTL